MSINKKLTFSKSIILFLMMDEDIEFGQLWTEYGHLFDSIDELATLLRALNKLHGTELQELNHNLKTYESRAIKKRFGKMDTADIATLL